MRSGYLAKASLFKPPFGWLFRMLGGYPVDRSKSNKLVDQVVGLFNSKDRFVLAITPEGTRKKVKEWKSGFYYIAIGARIPIVMAKIDYVNRMVRFSAPFYPTGNYEVDMATMKAYFYDDVSQLQ